MSADMAVKVLDESGRRWMGFPGPLAGACQQERATMPKSTPTPLGFAVCLDRRPDVLRGQAFACLPQRDVLGFLIKADNQHALSLVAKNANLLLSPGVYEIALLHALTSSRLNSFHCPPRLLRTLVARADQKRLRTAGDPLPGPGPYTLYRGVAAPNGSMDCHGHPCGGWRNSSPIAPTSAACPTPPSISSPSLHRPFCPLPMTGTRRNFSCVSRRI